MNVRCIFIEPSDVWLFRDARPFSAGEAGRAVGIFPPTPQTMQGAIRSLRLSQSLEPFDYRLWSDTLKGQIGQPNDYGALALRGPLLARRTIGSLTRYFPLPHDITKVNGKFHLLMPTPDKNVRANWPMPDPKSPPALFPLLPPHGTPEKFEMGWVPESALAAYLMGTPPTEFVPSSVLFERESRNGIEMDNHPKRPHEGRLYQAEFVRLREGVGLLLEVGDTVPLNPGGSIALGGEARAGRYETVTAFDAPGVGQRRQLLPALDGTLRFKLYLASPAIFRQGWLPEWIDPVTLHGQKGGVGLTLVSAALGKPQNIGGRSIVSGGGARPMHRAIPAGSVYFFETSNLITKTSNLITNVIQAFDAKNISDLDPEIGYGLTYVGGW